MRGFDFFVGGIEDGIIAVLTNAHGTSAPEPNNYARTIASYGGEMDRENLRQALSELVPTLPMFLVSYGDGQDVHSPATTAVPPGVPRYFRHDCTFTVICASDNARGEQARRRGANQGVGVYKMIEDTWSAIAGLQFKIIAGSETVLLNPEPLKPSGVEYIARLPDLTAYAVHFDTYFRYQTPDRTEPGELVQELIFEVEHQYPKGESNLPGVVLR